MQQLCFGVVGVGVMGQLYARLLTESPQTRLCGVADVVREKAEQVARQYGVPAFANTHELLDTVAVDALVIATDDHQHVGPVCDAAQAGKAILLEKPLATSVADGRAILGQVATSGVRLMVAPEEALAAVAVAEAIDRSAASGHIQTPTDSRPVSY